MSSWWFICLLASWFSPPKTIKIFASPQTWKPVKSQQNPQISPWESATHLWWRDRSGWRFLEDRWVQLEKDARESSAGTVASYVVNDVGWFFVVGYTHLKFNSECSGFTPEKWCLEDDSASFWCKWPIFRGELLNFRWVTLRFGST